MTDEELKELVANNALAISELRSFQQTEAREWRHRIDRENTEWKASVEDAIGLASEGLNDVGTRLENEIAETRQLCDSNARAIQADSIAWREVRDRLQNAITTLIQRSLENMTEHERFRETIERIWVQLQARDRNGG